MADSKNVQVDSYKGWLYKWTNYIKGYQKRWFVLQNGLLSYYRNQAEMSHTCRGTINLANAFIHTEDSCTFVISNGGAQSFHLKASSEVERQRWVTALELAKAKAIKNMESDDEGMAEASMQPDKNELEMTLRSLASKLEDLNTCNDLILKHGTALHKSLSDCEQMDVSNPESTVKLKAINERGTLFQITTNAMINACADYLHIAQTQGKRWHRMLQHEHEQRLRLEEMVEQIAKQHSSLERRAKKSMAKVNLAGSKTVAGANSNSHEDSDDEFYDALDENTEEFHVALPHAKQSMHRRNDSGVSQVSIDSLGANLAQNESESSDSDSEDSKDMARVISSRTKTSKSTAKSRSGASGSQDSLTGSLIPTNTVARKRRVRIPEKPDYSINLWSIMKNCIGRDLTKIPMPVNFSEPLSMLQRLTEELEYAHILDKAARCEDSCEQLAFVAAFTVSAYATTIIRTGKPFNPLLGETYECDRRDDFGWRSFTEQVSHHPPTLATYAEGKEWTLWQEFTMSSKFRGKYLSIVPKGIAHLEFKKSGNHYTWRKVTTTVHNIIVGRLWVDNHGEMDINNHHNGDKCHLKYSQYSYFSRETPRKVSGVVTNNQGETRWVLTGTWDDKIDCAKVLSTKTTSKGTPIFESGPHKMLWRNIKPPSENEKIYWFTKLAMQLNEPEELISPSDSRHRPDQRMMELQDWESANKEKLRLEEKQRTARKKRESDMERTLVEGKPPKQYEPAWFRKLKDPVTGNPIHVFTGEYWSCKDRQDWSRCPDIY